MVIVEKSFPRGGVTPKEAAKSTEPKEKIIFGALQKKEHKPKPKAKTGASDVREGDDIKTISAELLNYETIQDGMIIMGMVKAVDQLYLTVSLPGQIFARISVLEISEAYTKITQSFLQDSQKTEYYKLLVDLYQPGQLLYGRVLEVKKLKGRRVGISMSLKPGVVHAEMSHTNVFKGFVFCGAIEEVQEHGYIIESGIKGLRTFLPVEKSKPTRVVGQLIYLRVEKVTHDKTASTCICKETSTDNVKVKSQLEPNIDYLVPSTVVKFEVTKCLKDGLQGSLMNGVFTGYINEHQLKEPLAMPGDYELHSILNARVLYVMPLTKLVYLSLNLHINENNADEEQLQRGDIIEKAKVHHLGTGGVILVLKNKFKGIISFKRIKASYKGNYDQDKLLCKYAKKTEHTVRVLNYDLMDSMYVCTDDSRIVNEKVLDLKDLHAGDFATAIVKGRKAKVKGYSLQIGQVKGIIEKLFLSPNTKTLERLTKLRCRVIAVNPERKVAYLSNRPEYLSKDCKVLTSLTDAKPNAVFTGTIVKCFDGYFLVKFFNNLKGMLHKHQFRDLMSTEVDSFYVGQTMPFRIVQCKEEQIVLGLLEDTFQLGEICNVTVLHVLDSGLEVKVTSGNDNSSGEMNALIPMRLLSDFDDLLDAKMRTIPPQTSMQAVCMFKNIFSLRDVTYFEKNAVKNWRTVEPGDILKAYIKNVAPDSEVIELMVPIRGYNKLVKIHHKMLLTGAFRKANIALEPEQVVYVKVLGKEQITKTITVTAKLTDVWDGNLKATADYLNSYLDEVRDIKKAFAKLGYPMGKFVIGQKIKAGFQGVHPESGDWLYKEATTQLPAVMKISFLGKGKPPKVDTVQECVVLWVDYSNELLYISNRAGDIEHISTESTIPTNLVGKNGINAKVLLKLENLFICSMKKSAQPLVLCPARMHFNDLENSASYSVKEGDFCRLTFIDDRRPIAVLESTWKLWKEINRKRKLAVPTNAETPKSKKQKISTSNDSSATDKATKKRSISETDNPQLFFEDKSHDEVLKDKFTKLSEVETKKAKKTVSEVKSLPGISNFWSTDLSQLNEKSSNNVSAAMSSDEEDHDDDKNSTDAQKKKKKVSSVEKFKMQRAEEERLRAIEEQYADPNHVPESVDQFDRLVLSEPNISKHWINYMVYHLQATEIDKARAVARRAMKSISFRCADELLNIWVALLNLELRYGNKESFDAALKEALTCNEPVKVYLRALEMLADAGRTQDLIEMIALITKKFKTDPEMWKAVASAYFNIDMVERAQQMLHKALASLPEREHVNTIVMFANLNHKHGHNELAQTLLDQVVTSYPKRVDVWTQYVDMLVKENLIDSARSVLERAVIQKIPLKKMRTIFKKYLEFEERFGTEAEVQNVKSLAAKYVKQNSQL